MGFHPYQYEQLVAERHAQIRHDMQLSRAQPKQRTHAQPLVGKLTTRLQERSAQQQHTEQQSQTLLHAS